MGRSFDAAVDSYERARPGYPPEAIAWMIAPHARRVLDLGAGTGKLSRQLDAAGYDVVAVEPLPGMRAGLAAAVPDIEVLDGSAEHIPLPDGAVDAVVVGQAWHWFDERSASAETARVLRPEGTLGIAWNFADERLGWVTRLWRVLHAASQGPIEGRRGEAEAPALGEAFAPAESAEFTFEQLVDASSVLELVQSRSYVIELPAERREALLADVRELLRTEPEIAGRSTFPLPYRTLCWRATRR